MNPREFYQFLSDDEYQAHFEVMDKMLTLPYIERAMRLHIMTEFLMQTPDDRLKYYMAGLTTTMTKDFPGDREQLKTAIEGIMHTITVVEKL